MMRKGLIYNDLRPCRLSRELRLPSVSGAGVSPAVRLNYAEATPSPPRTTGNRPR